LKKCMIGMREIKYMGHIISSNGLKPDPEKISSIVNMNAPQNKTELQRFLGFVNYLGKFLPRLSEISAPLRSLLKDDAVWVWEKLHDDTFHELIKMVTSAPTLQNFDFDKPVTVQCDASQFGLGASLLQGGKPVAYISRTLSKTEALYAQIEKECLAVVYALDRFEQYLFGKPDVTVETDHKPLETIFKKPLTSAPKRLQRMLLRLQRFPFNVIYKPGKSMLIADFLSRAPMIRNKQYQEKDVQIFSSDTLRTQSHLPIYPSMLLSKVPNSVVKKWDCKKLGYKKSYDRGTKKLHPLIGQDVWVKQRPQLENEPWVEGKVVKKEGRREGRRKYEVEVNGKSYVRNRRFLRE
jgi:hypothetical protein